MSFLPITWIQIGIFILCTPYSLAVFFIFILKIKQPSIRERFPFLVLLSATCCLTIIFLNTIPCFFFQTDSHRNQQELKSLCIIEKIKCNLLWWLIIVPIIFRAFKFLKIKKIVEKFSRHQNADCLQKYSLFYLSIIIISLLVLFIFVVQTFIMCFDLSVQVFSISELNPTCRYFNNQTSNIFSSSYLSTLFSLYLTAAFCQLVVLVFFVFSLKGIKAKYNINMELQNICIIWNFQQIVSLIVTALPFSAENDSYLKTVESLGCMGLITVTILIPLLQMKRYEEQKNKKGCPELCEEFPEALFFWTPNHYYDKFLRRRYPNLVPYRPLLADILRFDYQITQYLEKYSLIELNNAQSSTEQNRKSSK